MSDSVRFLSRWSRLKRQARVEAPAAPALMPESRIVSPGEIAAGADAAIAPGTDLTALLREELSDAVRKQALKAIFADPHFNVMDGLDTYIDDYSISEPIPPEMMATLNQARFLLASDEEKGGQAADEVNGQIEPGCDNLNRCGQEVSVAQSTELAEKEK